MLGNARIMATKKTKGDWLAIIDTDDLWSPNKLETQIKAINETKLPKDSIGLVYSKTMGIDENSLITNELCHSDFLDNKCQEGILNELLFKGNFIVSASILLNKKFFIGRRFSRRICTIYLIIIFHVPYLVKQTLFVLMNF